MSRYKLVEIIAGLKQKPPKEAELELPEILQGIRDSSFSQGTKLKHRKQLRNMFIQHFGYRATDIDEVFKMARPDPHETAKKSLQQTIQESIANEAPEEPIDVENQRYSEEEESDGEESDLDRIARSTQNYMNGLYDKINKGQDPENVFSDVFNALLSFNIISSLEQDTIKKILYKHGM